LWQVVWLPTKRYVRLRFFHQEDYLFGAMNADVRSYWWSWKRHNTKQGLRDWLNFVYGMLHRERCMRRQAEQELRELKQKLRRLTDE
jgi:hypothetical protein